MSLDNASADAAATAICSAMGVSDATTIAQYKKFIEALYAHIKADIVVTLAAGSVVTTGSAATQTGPAAPVVLTVT
jgi:ApbE superfamily uncharacterized protein (UPF0280 family)